MTPTTENTPQMKTPLFTEKMLLRLPKEMTGKLGRKAREVGQTANEFVREAIRKHLEDQDAQKRK